MKKILYTILSPLVMVVLYFYSKDEMVAEFEDFHNERNEMMSNGTWTEEDEKVIGQLGLVWNECCNK